MSHAIKLEKSLEKLATALSEFDDQFTEIQDASIPDTNSTCSKFAAWRVLECINGGVANVGERLVEIHEDIEQLKTYEKN